MTVKKYSWEEIREEFRTMSPKEKEKVRDWLRQMQRAEETNRLAEMMKGAGE